MSEHKPAWMHAPSGDYEQDAEWREDMALEAERDAEEDAFERRQAAPPATERWFCEAGSHLDCGALCSERYQRGCSVRCQEMDRVMDSEAGLIDVDALAEETEEADVLAEWEHNYMVDVGAGMTGRHRE